MSDDRFEGSDDAAASRRSRPRPARHWRGFDAPAATCAHTATADAHTPSVDVRNTRVSGVAAATSSDTGPDLPVAQPQGPHGACLTVLLVLVAVALGFANAAYFRRISALGDIIDGSLDLDTVRRVHDADDFVRAGRPGSCRCSASPSSVLIIILDLPSREEQRSSRSEVPAPKPGWAIAGRAHPAGQRRHPPADPPGPVARFGRDDEARLHVVAGQLGIRAIGWYWAFLLVSVVRNGFGRTRARLIVTDELRELRTHDTIVIVGLVAAIAAAVLAIQVVRRIAARQDECLRTQQADWYGAG